MCTKQLLSEKCNLEPKGFSALAQTKIKCQKSELGANQSVSTVKPRPKKDFSWQTQLTVVARTKSKCKKQKTNWVCTLGSPLNTVHAMFSDQASTFPCSGTLTSIDISSCKLIVWYPCLLKRLRPTAAKKSMPTKHALVRPSPV